VRPTPVICGPTAGGKSDLALALARIVRESPEGRARWPRGAAILAADAFQVYRGLDIASAKPTTADRAACEHLLIDLVEPSETFTASQWLTLAKQAIEACRGAGKLPIVVGGTHLYIKLLVDGMFEGPAADEALRERLRQRGLASLREQLERVDPAAAARIHPNDERRTIRALEVFELTGKPISEHQQQWEQGSGTSALGGTQYLLAVLDWPIEAINRRINARVKAMMERGMLEETRRLMPVLGPTAREALGTKQLLEHIRGDCTLEEAVERIKIETRRFAKNQRTWLKRLRSRGDAITLDASGAAVDPISLLPVPPVERWAAAVFARLTAGAGSR
jgi:tRNA dimethylallyltransferase